VIATLRETTEGAGYVRNRTRVLATVWQREPSQALLFGINNLPRMKRLFSGGIAHVREQLFSSCSPKESELLKYADVLAYGSIFNNLGTAKISGDMSATETHGYMDAAGKGNRKSKKCVFGRRNENAGAAGFAPYTMIDAVGIAPDVIAGIKLLVIDHQLAIKQMQLFHSGMAVRRIIGSRREPHQHADTVFLRIGGEQFAGDARRHFFPFWFSR